MGLAWEPVACSAQPILPVCVCGVACVPAQATIAERAATIPKAASPSPFEQLQQLWRSAFRGGGTGGGGGAGSSSSGNSAGGSNGAGAGGAGGGAGGGADTAGGASTASATASGGPTAVGKAVKGLTTWIAKAAASHEL